jgi:hypothetical protein
MSVYVPPVHELAIVGAFEAGVPNRERIVIRPTEAVNLAGFGLVLSLVNDDGSVTPVPNHFLWLGDRWVVPPTWLVVFTGPGAFREGAHQETGAPVLEFHWGLQSVVLGTPRIALSIVRFGGLSSQQVGPNSAAQLPRLRTP